MKKQPIKCITPESFAKYGVVIALKPDSKDGWEIVVEAQEKGWRIAVLEVTRRAASRLENHRFSKESFEPLSGVAILLVAENPLREGFEAYLLDRPVCLNEGIWHEIISLSAVAQVKITENLEVDCEYLPLPAEAFAALVL